MKLIWTPWSRIWVVCLVLVAGYPGPIRAQDAAPDRNGGIRYQTELQGVDGALRDLITGSLNLYALQDRLPPSVTALRARLTADLDTIETVLRSEGYYAFRVEHALDAAARPAEVTLVIDTGPRYRLDGFHIRYVDAERAPGLPSDPAFAGITLGEAARSGTILDAQSRLVRRLGERGHPFARVTSREVVVDHGAQTVVVTLEVEAGPKTAFGPLAVVGNEGVRESYIRRVADLEQGTPFDTSQVDDARRRLFESGLFDSVTIGWAEQPDEAGEVVVTVRVIERKRRSVGVGLNYSTTEGAGLDLGWTHRNVFGRGERADLGARIAEREFSAFGEFVKPNMGRLEQDLTGRVEGKKVETEAFDQTSVIGSIGLRRNLTENWRGSAATSVEATEIREPGKVKQSYVIFGLPVQLFYDGSDDLLDPARGTRLTVTATPTQVTGDSSAQFLVGGLGGSAYYEALSDRRLVLAARARFASIVGAARDDVPASRRLYAGGGGSIRGYEYQSVGPLDTFNNPQGGLSAFDTSFEARIRVYENFGIVPFIDGGSAFERRVPGGSSLRWAAGLGFRYHTVVGPLRLDFAVPINPRPDVDDAFAFYISLGQAF
jgi:translocation and assembly module TamA